MSTVDELRQSLELSMSTGSFYDALRIAEQLREELPDDPFAWLEVAMLKSVLGDTDYAIQELNTLVKKHKDFVHGWQPLSALLVIKGRWIDAEKALRIVIRLDPSDPTVWQNLGYVFYRTDRTTAAKRSFRRSIRIKPSAVAWGNLGSIHENEGDLEKALP